MERMVAVLLTLALTAIAPQAQAQTDDFPSRPIRLIVGFPPGASADIPARLIGNAMSRTLGQPIIVENRPGAGGSLAAEQVARSPADGYTLYMGTATNVSNAAIGNTNLRFDFVKDFTAVTPLADLPFILTVHPALGVSSVKELIALAKSKPGELTYASVGHGTIPHLATELFALRTEIKLLHVPYQGSPPAVTDLLAGRVSVMFGVASTVMPHVEAGRIKALASGSAKRAHVAPNLPTFAEAGLPGLEASVWFGLMAPAGTPRPVIDKLAGAANGALKSDDVVTKLKASGYELLGGSPENFAKLILRETEKWNDLAKAAGMTK